MQLPWYANKLFWVGLLTVGLAFIESAVVVYLRELYYPNGFSFPLKPMPADILFVEIGREAATLLILVAIGFVAGSNPRKRFAYFLFSFGIWDIFYYVFLKVILNWPESFLTWDILFLIPTTWTGPVLAPVILSVTMIGLTILILHYENSNQPMKFARWPMVLLISGSVLVIISFIWDYSAYMLRHYTFFELFNPASAEIVTNVALQYLPANYSWGLFAISEMLILGGIFIARISRK